MLSASLTSRRREPHGPLWIEVSTPVCRRRYVRLSVAMRKSSQVAIKKSPLVAK